MPALVHKISSSGTSSTEAGTKTPGKGVATSSQSSSLPQVDGPVQTTSSTKQRNSGNSPATPSPSTNEPSVHTVESTIVVTPTFTETTTVPPESTFSKPVAVTSVQAGITSIGTPPLVTVLSTSTYSNGSAVTYVNVYANPAVAAQSNSFLQNTGAVAGVFAVVGIIAACLLLSILYLIRRIYRKSRQSRWHLALRHDHDPDSKTPFYDQDSGLVLHSALYGAGSPVDSSRMVHHAYDTPPSYPPGMSGIRVTTESRQWLPETEGPFSDIHAHKRNSIGGAESTQQANTLDLDDITPQSTPSIYPTTLPPIESEIETVVETPVEQPGKRTEPKMMEDARVEQLAERNETKPEVAFVARETRRPRTAEAPPRPPKSILRSRSHSLRTGGLHNPRENSSSPISSSSGSPSDYSSYQARHTILKRQTLLDVRPRSAHADAGSTMHARK